MEKECWTKVAGNTQQWQSERFQVLCSWLHLKLLISVQVFGYHLKQYQLSFPQILAAKLSIIKSAIRKSRKSNFCFSRKTVNWKRGTDNQNAWCCCKQQSNCRQYQTSCFRLRLQNRCMLKVWFNSSVHTVCQTTDTNNIHLQVK